jgi:hypothetical protein
MMMTDFVFGVSLTFPSAIANILSYAETADPRAIINNPFADQVRACSLLGFLDTPLDEGFH